MAALDGDATVIICAPVDGNEPHTASVQTTCCDCGYAVWVSNSMKTNVIDVTPNSKCRCLTCARKRALRGEYDNVEFEHPEWQREELADLTEDLDELHKTAERWLHGT